MATTKQKNKSAKLKNFMKAEKPMGMAKPKMGMMKGASAKPMANTMPKMKKPKKGM